MKILRRVVLLALFAGAGYLAYRFAGTNATEVSVDLVFVEAPPVALWLALLSSFGIGALAAAGFLLFELAKMGLVTRRYRKAVRGLESEIHQLRNLPLAGEPEGSASGAADSEAGVRSGSAGTSA